VALNTSLLSRKVISLLNSGILRISYNGHLNRGIKTMLRYLRRKRLQAKFFLIGTRNTSKMFLEFSA